MKKNLLFFAVLLLCIKVNAQCIFPTSSFCAGTTISGGTWSSSDNAIATVDASTGAIHGVSSGSVTLTYTTSLGYVTFPFTVNDVPVVSTLTGTTTVCVASSTALASSTTGGTWSTSNTSVATVDGSGNVWGVSAGNATISYGVANTCGTTYQTAIVTVNPLPDAGTLGGAESVCAGSSTTYTTTASGGTWSSSDNAIATTDAGGNVYGATAGNATISYTVTNSCGTASSTRNITVLPLPDAGTISGSISVCAGSDINLSSTVTGGTWSSSNTTVATVSSAGLLHGRTAGSTTTTYSYTNSCGTAITTYAITVNPLPNAGTISPATVSVCAKSTITLTSSGDPGGTWSSDNTIVATVGSAGNVYGKLGPGAANITYQVTNSCGVASTTRAVYVKGYPSIIGAPWACLEHTVTLTGVPSTVSGVWSSVTSAITTTSSGNIGTYYGNSLGTKVGIFTVTLASETSQYCAGSAADTVSITTIPTTPVLSGPSSVAVGSTIVLSASPSGTWSVSNTAIATLSGTGSSRTIGGATAGSVTISVIPSGYCTVIGTYAVSVTASGHKSSGGNSFDNTGATTNIRISPNPNGGRFTVSTPEGTTYAVITITDINGRVVATRKTDKQDNDFDLGMRARGMYVVTVETNSKKYSQKIQID